MNIEGLTCSSYIQNICYGTIEYNIEYLLRIHYFRPARSAIVSTDFALGTRGQPLMSPDFQDHVPLMKIDFGLFMKADGFKTRNNAILVNQGTVNLLGKKKGNQCILRIHGPDIKHNCLGSLVI